MRRALTRFKELAACEVGEVRTLATCKECNRPVRVFVDKSGFVLMRSHRWHRARCAFSGADDFLNVQYSLQEQRVSGKRGLSIQRLWIPIGA